MNFTGRKGHNALVLPGLLFVWPFSCKSGGKEVQEKETAVSFPPHHRLKLPPGFQIDTNVEDIDGTRSMTPGTGELWFTDNGRDLMGDNAPPCKLNRVTGTGQHFG